MLLKGRPPDEKACDSAGYGHGHIRAPNLSFEGGWQGGREYYEGLIPIRRFAPPKAIAERALRPWADGTYSGPTTASGNVSENGSRGKRTTSGTLIKIRSALLFLALATPYLALAQSATGISGTLTDAAGQIILVDGVKYVTPQAALSALGGKPGTVLVPPGTYAISSLIAIGQGQTLAGIAPSGEGDGSRQGPVILKMANNVNLSPMIKINGSQAALVNLVVDGNKSNNPTAGPCVVHAYMTSGVSAQRQLVRDVTIQNCKGDGSEVLSTLPGYKNEAAATQFDHVMFLNNDMDGLYCANTSDVWVDNRSEAENNGLGGGPNFVGAYTRVNTSGTSVTWVSGPKWTTDASMGPTAFSALGRVVSINNVRYRIASVASTTSLTLSSSAGTQSGVTFRMGHGVELKDCQGSRYQGSDIAGNEMDGMYLEGTIAIGSNLTLITNNQFGSNVEHDIEIQGWDSVGGGYGSQAHFIVGNLFIGRQNTSLYVTSTFDSIYVQDSQENQITGNGFHCFPANTYKYGVQIHETVGGREGRDNVSANNFQATFSTTAFLSDAVTPTAFNANKDTTNTTLFSQPVLANNDWFSIIDASGTVRPILKMDASNNLLIQGHPAQKAIDFTPDGSNTVAQAIPGGLAVLSGRSLIFIEGKPSGAFSGGDVCSGDSTLHAIQCSINSSNFHRLPIVEFGACLMSAATTCTFSANTSFADTPLCFVTIDQASSVPATANVAKCSITGTTVTITAGSSNSLVWDAMLVGNPN